MQNRIYTACDNCATVLDGLHKAAKVKKSYLTIKGTICLKSYDKQNTEHYTYALFKDEAALTYLHFCNGTCLDEYMQGRLILKAKYHSDHDLPFVDYAPGAPKLSTGDK